MEVDESNIAALVLAAGEGKRFGRTKALIEIDGVNFLHRVVDSLRTGGLESITVVGGADADEVKNAAKILRVHFVLNRDWQTGQFSSLKAGVMSLANQPDGLMIALVDHPFIKPKTCSLLIEKFSENRGKVVLPVHDNRRGHPIIIPGEVIEEVKKSSPDANLRQIIGKHHELVVELPVNDAGILKDIDTSSDLKGAPKA